jgi:hypothetical protein
MHIQDFVKKFWLLKKQLRGAKSFPASISVGFIQTTRSRLSKVRHNYSLPCMASKHEERYMGNGFPRYLFWAGPARRISAIDTVVFFDLLN